MTIVVSCVSTCGEFSMPFVWIIWNSNILPVGVPDEFDLEARHVGVPDEFDLEARHVGAPDEFDLEARHAH